MKNLFTYAFKANRKVVSHIIIFTLINVFVFLMFNITELIIDSPKAFINRNNIVIISILIVFLLFFISLFIRFNSKKEKEAYRKLQLDDNHLFKAILLGDTIYYIISFFFGLLLSISIFMIFRYSMGYKIHLRFLMVLLYLVVPVLIYPLLSFITIYYKKIGNLFNKYNYLPYVISLVSVFSFAFVSKGTFFVVLFIITSILVSPYIILKLYQLLTKLRGGTSSSNLFRNFFVKRRMGVLYVVSFIVLMLGVKSYVGQVNTYKESSQFFNYEYVINRLAKSKYEELSQIDSIKLMPISEEYKAYLNESTMYIYETDFNGLLDFTNINILEGNTTLINPNTILINEEYAAKYDIHVGDKIEINRSNDSYEFIVGAIFSSNPSYISFVPLSTFSSKQAFDKTLVITNYLQDETKDIGKEYNVRFVSKQLDYNSFFGGPISYLVISTISLVLMVGLFVTLNVFMNYTVKETEMNNLKIFKLLPVYQNSLSRIIYLNKFTYFMSCLIFFVAYFLLSYTSQLNLFKESKISMLSTMSYSDFFSFVLEIFIFYNIIFLMEYILTNPLQGVDDER